MRDVAIIMLVSAIFHRIFVFSPNGSSLQTIAKCFLFNQKSFFRS